MTYETSFICNREVRLIPEGWEHPRREDGRFVPLLADDMPEVEHLPRERVRLVAYETTTEGTPISPAFPDSPEGKRALVDYCAANCPTFGRHMAGAEAWAVILFRQDVVITIDGQVLAQDA